MADEKKQPDLSQLRDDEEYQLPNGMWVDKATAVEMAAMFGADWQNATSNPDLFNAWAERRAAPTTARAGLTAATALPGLSGIGALGAGAVNALKAGKTGQALWQVAQALGLGAGAGLNAKTTYDDPVSGLAGLAGARGGAALLNKLKGGPVATALAGGLGGLAGMEAGAQVQGESFYPEGSGFLDKAKNAALVGGLSVAPLAPGAVANLVKNRAIVPTALTKLETALGRQPGTLLTKGTREGTVLKPGNLNSEATLTALGPRGQTALNAIQTGVPANVTARSFRARKLTLDRETNDLRRQLHEAKVAVTAAENAADEAAKVTANQKLQQLQTRLNTVKNSKAEARSEWEKARQELLEGSGYVPDRETRASLLATDTAYRVARAGLDVEGTATTGTMDLAKRQRIQQAGLSKALETAKAKQQQLTGAQYALNDRHLAEQAAWYAEQDLKTAAREAALRTFDPAERKLAESFRTLEANKLGPALFDSGTTGWNTAVKLAPVHERAFREVVVNELIERASYPGSLQVDPTRLPEVVAKNLPIVQKAFPGVKPDELNAAFREVADIFTTIQKNHPDSALDRAKVYTEARLFTIPGKIARTLASPALVAGDAFVRWGNGLVNDLVTNPELRRSALAWAEEGRTGRLTGDAGRAWLSYLRSAPDEAPAVDDFEELDEPEKAQVPGTIDLLRGALADFIKPR